MPSIVPSYVYTLFASVAVGAMLICFSGLSTINVKHEAEKQQLRNIAEYIATKSSELISAKTVNNVTTSLTLNVPSLVGNQKYWIRLANDSSLAWVESGYGTIPQLVEQEVPIPFKVLAHGSYVSGSGAAVLECFANDTEICLELSGGA